VTTIKIISHPQTKRFGKGEGIGTVDGYSAKIIKFSDGGVCAVVKKNSSRIYFR